MNYAIYLPYAIIGLAVLGALHTLLRAARKKPSNKRVALASVLLGFVIYPALVVTPYGHRAVIYSSVGGIQTHERPEGFSLIIPYFQSAAQVNVQTQKHQVEAYAQSSDLQEITVPVAVNYHINPTQAAELYRDVGLDYAQVLIDPAVLQLAKAEVGLVKAVDFAQNRSALALSIQTQLSAQLAPYGIVVEFVAVEDAVFDPDFIAAVKAKVIADEKAAEEARLVAAAQSRAAQVEATAAGEAARIRIEAEAQAEANAIIAASITNDLLIWQRIIQWDGVLPVTFLGTGDSLDLLFAVE